MATNTLATNIGQTVNDFADIREAIIEKGVPVPLGTKTSEYEDLIRAIQIGGNPDDIVAQAVALLQICNNGNSVSEPEPIGPDIDIFTSKITDGSFACSLVNMISEWSVSLEKLVTGRNMFNETGNLYSFQSNLDSLVDGYAMFGSCASMANFNTDSGVLPNLENGAHMFSRTRLHSFYTDMPRLKNGDHMFESVGNLENFSANLISLESGDQMFTGTNYLTVESLESILNDIPDRTGLTPATLTLNPTNLAKLTAGQIAIGTSKNWIIN